jgi:hypothetical protein
VSCESKSIWVRRLGRGQEAYEECDERRVCVFSRVFESVGDVRGVSEETYHDEHDGQALEYIICDV